MAKIFIDAGHNYASWDTGATGNGLKEQDINWEIANQLNRMCKNGQFETKMSRPNKTDILGVDFNSSLKKRCDMCNSWGADLFISLHCNANTNVTANGTETYCFRQGSDGERLATYINKALVDLGLKDRGVKTANFYVLKHTNCPAVLVEIAFITNTEDSKILRDKQDDIANAIYSGIRGYFGVQYCDTVNHLIEDNVTTSPQHWQDVFDGKIPPNKDYIKALCDNYHKLVDKLTKV